MTESSRDNQNITRQSQRRRKNDHSRLRSFPLFNKKILRRLAFVVFLIVMVYLTLIVSFRIAFNRARKINRHITQATELLMKGRFKESLDHFDKAIAGRWQRRQALSGKGLCLLYLKRYEESLASYERLLKISPKSAQGWQGKGISLEYLGQFDEAIRCYDRTLEISPNFGSVKVQRERLMERIKNAP